MISATILLWIFTIFFGVVFHRIDKKYPDVESPKVLPAITCAVFFMMAVACTLADCVIYLP